MSSRFAKVESEWQARLGKLRDVVRQELVARQLNEHLPGAPVRVLDAGCGQGTQALRLARLGHTVTGVDASADLLDTFGQALAAERADVRSRVRAVHAAIEHLADVVEPASFDVVLCHGVLMYFDDPADVVASLAAAAAPDGLVSLLVRNGDALAMRPGLLGDWATALAAFDSGSYLNRLGALARADRLDELAATLGRHGLVLRHWYGVRVFADTAADDALPPAAEELAALLACEERAGRTDPYRGVAPLLHVLAARDAPIGPA